MFLNKLTFRTSHMLFLIHKKQLLGNNTFYKILYGIAVHGSNMLSAYIQAITCDLFAFTPREIFYEIRYIYSRNAHGKAPGPCDSPLFGLSSSDRLRENLCEPSGVIDFQYSFDIESYFVVLVKTHTQISVSYDVSVQSYYT